VQAGDTTYHVQTEDRGVAHALIDTTVYFRGRVLHRRTNNYFDLLPLDAAREQALKLRVDEQHRTIVEQIQSGALAVALPRRRGLPLRPQRPLLPQLLWRPVLRRASLCGSKAELINPRTWLTGKRAVLQIVVRGPCGQCHRWWRLSLQKSMEPPRLRSFPRSQADSAMPVRIRDAPRSPIPMPLLVVEGFKEAPEDSCVFN